MEGVPKSHFKASGILCNKCLLFIVPPVAFPRGQQPLKALIVGPLSFLPPSLPLDLAFLWRVQGSAFPVFHPCYLPDLQTTQVPHLAH